MSRIRKPRTRRPNATTPIEIELRDLDVFLNVVESGSMSLTARRLGLTQSAVSQVISALEAALGVKLFDRDIRPLGLTPPGAILKSRATALLRDARDTVQAVRRPDRTALPHLHLALIDSMASAIGPQLVAELRDMADQWSIWAGLTHEHQAALISRKVDVIIATEIETIGGMADLERHDVLREPHLVLVPARYTGPVDDLATLAEHMDFIRFSVRSHIGLNVETHLKRLKIEPPYRMEFDNSDGLLAMVAAGAGWALATPLCVLQATHYLPHIRCLPMPRPVLHRQLRVMARRGELGDVPARVAAAAAAIFKQRCVPRIEAFAPEAAAAITFGNT